jgi:hypothetical protein
MAAPSELLQPLGVLILNDDPQLGFGIADMDPDVARIDRREAGIEISRLRIRICPRIVRHVHPPRSLRGSGENMQ